MTYTHWWDTAASGDVLTYIMWNDLVDDLYMSSNAGSPSANIAALIDWSSNAKISHLSDIRDNWNSATWHNSSIIWSNTLQNWLPYKSGAGTGGIDDIVEDTTPQLGGNLDANSKGIYNATGISGTKISGGVIYTDNIDVRTSPLVISENGTNYFTILETAAGVILKGKDSTLKTFQILPNTIDPQPYIVFEGNDDIIYNVSSSKYHKFQTDKFGYAQDGVNIYSPVVWSDGLYKVSGQIAGSEKSSTPLIIQGNVLDLYPRVKLVGSGNLELSAGKDDDILMNIGSALSFKIDSSYISAQTGLYSGFVSSSRISANTLYFKLSQAQDIDDGAGGGWDSSAYNNSGIKWDATEGRWEPMPSGGSGGGGIDDIVEDTTPQLGGNLDANSKGIYGLPWISGTKIVCIDGIHLENNLYHRGDTDTYLSMSDDIITLLCGGTSIWQGYESPNLKELRINHLGAGVGGSVNLRVKGDDEDYVLFVSSAANKVGIRQPNPIYSLHVSGTTYSDVVSGSMIKSTIISCNTYHGPLTGAPTDYLHDNADDTTTGTLTAKSFSGPLSGANISGGKIKTDKILFRFGSSGIYFTDSNTRIYEYGTNDLTLEADADIHLKPDNKIYLYQDGDSNIFATFDCPNERFYIGGGDTTPSYTVHVEGSIYSPSISGTTISGNIKGNIIKGGHFSSNVFSTTIDDSTDLHINLIDDLKVKCDDFWVYNNNNEGYVIFDGGQKRVKIGSWTSPNYPLDVTGIIYTNDNIVAGESIIATHVVSGETIKSTTYISAQTGLYAHFVSANASNLAGVGTPGGNDTEVQFNDSDSFGGDSSFTWNKTTNTLDIAGAVSSQALSSNSIRFNAFVGTTDATAAQLETLTDGSNADALHSHAGVTSMGGPMTAHIGANDDYGLSGLSFVSSQKISGGTILTNTIDSDNTINYDSSIQHIFKDNGVQLFLISSIAGGSVVKGTTIDGADLSIFANSINDRPFIELEGNGDIVYDVVDNHLFKVGGNTKLTIDANRLKITGDDGTLPSLGAATRFVVQDNSGVNDNCAISIIAGSGNASSDLNFGDKNDENVASIVYQHRDEALRFTVNKSTKAYLNTTGLYVGGSNAPDYTLEVNGSMFADGISGSAISGGTIRFNEFVGATDATAAQLEELTDGSETTLHSHAGAASAPGGSFTANIGSDYTYGISGVAFVSSQNLFVSSSTDVHIHTAEGKVVYIEEAGRQVFKLEDVAGSYSQLEGGSDTTNTLDLKANSTDARPMIRMIGNGDIEYDVVDDHLFKVGGNTKLTVDTSNIILGTNLNANSKNINSANNIYGANISGVTLRTQSISSNSDIHLRLPTAKSFVIDHLGVQTFQFNDVAGTYSQIIGGPDTTNVLDLKANSTDARPTIRMEGNSDIEYDVVGDHLFNIGGSTKFTVDTDKVQLGVNLNANSKSILAADGISGSTISGSWNTPIYRGAGKPAASASYEGQIIRTSGASGEGTWVWICVQNSADGYEWLQLAVST